MRLNFSRVLSRSLGLMIASTALFLLMGVTSVYATDISVTTLTDVNDTGVDCSSMVLGDLPGADTKVSLREAICVTNNNELQDVITFGVTGTIVFASASPQIDEQDRLMINGADKIVLDGNSGAYDCFGTDLEDSTVANVTLQNFTFQNFGEASLCVSGTNWMVRDNYFLGTTGDTGAAMHVYGSGHQIRDNYVGLQSDGITKSSMYDGIVLQSTATSITLLNNYITSGGGCGIKFNGMGVANIVGNTIGLKVDGTSATPNKGICDNPGATHSGNVQIGGIGVASNTISGAVTNGIDLRGTYSNIVTIQGNKIGTTTDGTAIRANSNNGILILANCSGGPACVIGGITGDEKNIISGNTAAGLRFGNGASNWAAESNYIGLNAAGDAALANAQAGVLITGTATDITIGGPTGWNTISGNVGQAIVVLNASGVVKIAGNYIGTNPLGTAAIANGLAGILVDGGNANITVGIIDAVAPQNVISGNNARGIRIRNTLGGLVNVYSSIIGLNADQSAAIPNVQQAVLIDGTNAATITVGGTRAAGFNVITGNVTDPAVNNAIKIDDGSSATFKGNFIGTNSAGTLAIGNGANRDAIFIIGDNVAIGGTLAGDGNVIVGATGLISGNPAAQIRIAAEAANTEVYGNFIGVDPVGTGLGVGNNVGVVDQGSGTIIGALAVPGRNHFGNLVRAIHVKGSTSSLIANNYLGVKPDGTASGSVLGEGIAITNVATGTIIGGPAVTARNVIGNITGAGVTVDGATDLSVLGNYIGLAPDGVTDFGNGAHGVNVINATDLYIGRNVGDTTHAPNIISGNTGSGINLDSSGAISGVYIEASRIGTNAAGTAAVPNTVDGITVTSGSGVVIGGADATSRNVISGNGDDGIDINGADGVTVQGNYIGHGATIGTDVGNTASGINMRNGASSNVIGFLFSGNIDGTRRNFINFNNGSGIRLDGATTVLNTMRGNIIGTSNTLNAFSFSNEANNENSLQNTNIKNHTNALIDGKTNLRGKVDFYSINAADQITFEGSNAITNNGNFFLLKPFTTTATDRYFIQITTGAGDSTGYGVYRNVLVDETLPTRPTISSSTLPQTSTPLVISGGKDPYTGIWLNDSEVVPSDEENTWSYSVDLTEGLNELVFTAKDDAGNQSLPLIRNVILDTTVPAAPTVIANALVTGSADSPLYRVSGTKEANSAIWLNGSEAVQVNSNTNWIYDVKLVEGSNTFVFVAKDPVGNVSEDVVVNITYVKVPAYGGGGGGSGSTSVIAPPILIAPPPPPIVVEPSESEVVETPSDTESSESEVVESSPSDTESSVPEVVEPSDTESSETVTVSNPIDNQVVVDNIRNNYPVYTPDVQPTSPTVTAPPPPRPPLTTPQLGPEPISPVHPAAPSASTKFQTVLGTVASTETRPGEVSSVVQDQGVIIPSGSSNRDPIIIPSAMIDIAAIQIRTEEQGIIIPSAIVSTDSDSTEEADTVSDGEEVVVTVVESVAPPQNLVAVLESPVYAVITNDDDDNGVPDHLDPFGEDGLDPEADSDGDGINDGVEILLGTDVLDPDSNNDGIDDGVAIVLGLSPVYADSDQDGISDVDELDMGTDPLSADSDGDGVSDAEEVEFGGDATDATVSVADSDNDGIPDAAETQYHESAVGESVTYEIITGGGGMSQIVIKPSMVDTDGDGLSDLEEIKMGADPTVADTDGDGLTDAEEVKLFGTNPNEENTAEDIEKPSLVRQVQGATFSSNHQVVPGFAKPNAPVTVYFIPRQTEVIADRGWLASFSRWLMASLFEGSAEDGYYKVETVADAGGKFLAEADLPDGEFDVVVRTYDVNGEIEDEGLPFEIKVDTEIAAVGEVEPYQLDDQLIDVTDLQLITVGNNQPYIYGRAPRDYELNVMWASELFTSSLLIESDEEMGEFVVMAPELLENGEHDVTVQGIDQSQNLYTSAINVDFMVMVEDILSDENPMTRMMLTAFTSVGILCVAVFWLAVRTRRHQFVD